MEMRFLGGTGLKVSTLAFGTVTFGGQGEQATQVGNIEATEARQVIDVCIEHGVNLFDTADVYAQGRSEEVLGKALEGKRHDVLIATKVFGRTGKDSNDVGLTRHHIQRACEASLRRLNTDYIDLYQSHGFDSLTPLEETLAAYDDLIRAGKVRYIGCSNYSAWHLMKALSISERHNYARYVSHQAYYSLIGRELENELIPLSLDQNVGILVWGPLAQGFLTGKFRRGADTPTVSRYAHNAEPPLNMPENQAYDIVDRLIAIAQERNVSVTQVAINWVQQKPGVSSILFGARTMEQLRDNLNAATWQLSAEEMLLLDEVSKMPMPYPYWHQQKHGLERNPIK
jgi:aryl-alcohol dehydrogenase-like predicted oxidoreductase